MAKQRIETIFARDREVIDIKVLVQKGIDVLQSKIYFNDTLLIGGSESTKPYNECFLWHIRF